MQLPWERKKKPVRRRATKTIEQREREYDLKQKQEAIRTLRDAAPEEYRSILIDRARTELGVARRPNRLNGKDEQAGGFLEQLMNSDFAYGLGQALAGGAAGMMTGQKRMIMPAATPAAIAAPEVLPPSPSAVPPQAAPITAPLSMESRWLIGQMEGKTPEQRAAWLLSLDFPLAKELTGHLVTFTDDQLPQLWGAVVAANPHAAGFVAWIQAQPDYLATVAAVRQSAVPATNGVAVH